MLLLVLAALVGSGPPSGARAEAFRGIFEEHAPYAFRCLRRLGIAPGDADDVLQEVFLVVLRRHEEIEGPSLRPWIHGVCVRKASEFRRGLRRRRERVEGEVPEPASPSDAAMAADPEAQAQRSQSLQRLDRVLDDLPDAERAAFVLYEIEQLSLKEIAAALECPLSTAHSRLERARERVARAFSTAEGPTLARRLA